MGRHNFTNEQRKLLEGLSQPLAIYQFVDKRVVTLVLSNGFCKLFGYEDRAQAYYDMDNDMYKDVHPTTPRESPMLRSALQPRATITR